MGQRGRPPKRYALYQGDKHIADGTVRELSEKFFIDSNTLYHTLTARYWRLGRKIGSLGGFWLKRLEDERYGG